MKVENGRSNHHINEQPHTTFIIQVLPAGVDTRVSCRLRVSPCNRWVSNGRFTQVGGSAGRYSLVASRLAVMATPDKVRRCNISVANPAAHAANTRPGQTCSATTAVRPPRLSPPIQLAAKMHAAAPLVQSG